MQLKIPSLLDSCYHELNQDLITFLGLIANRAYNTNKKIRIAIIGGPGVGKSTLINALQYTHQQANNNNIHFTNEAATRIMTREKISPQNQNNDKEPMLKFQKLLRPETIQDYNNAKPGLTIYDRTLHDSNAYRLQAGLPLQNQDDFRLYPFNHFLLLPFNPSFFKNDNHRHEDKSLAKSIAEATKKYYYQQSQSPISIIEFGTNLAARINQAHTIIVNSQSTAQQK